MACSIARDYALCWCVPGPMPFVGAPNFGASLDWCVFVATGPSSPALGRLSDERGSRATNPQLALTDQGSGPQLALTNLNVEVSDHFGGLGPGVSERSRRTPAAWAREFLPVSGDTTAGVFHSTWL